MLHLTARSHTALRPTVSSRPFTQMAGYFFLQPWNAVYERFAIPTVLQRARENFALGRVSFRLSPKPPVHTSLAAVVLDPNLFELCSILSQSKRILSQRSQYRIQHLGLTMNLPLIRISARTEVVGCFTIGMKKFYVEIRAMPELSQ
jgi:hypothetical protein